MRRIPLASILLASIVTMACLPSVTVAEEAATDPATIPPIKTFLGDGFGARHDKAPAELDQFGQLVGLWTVEAEMAGNDGKFVKSAPGLWAWKYTIDGFAVSDLWYQGADNLPMYMANLGRDYLLTANRIYDVANKKWRVAWMANGAGKTMGADFGTFDAVLQDGEIVMTATSAGGWGQQRVVFLDITKDSFRWKSEYSMDEGKTWRTVMRMQAKRIRG